MIYIGIDPGAKGAMAMIDDEGNLIKTAPMTSKKIEGEKLIDITEIYRFIKHEPLSLDEKMIVYLEKAQSMPRQGVASMFTYGVGYGMILAMLIFENIEFRLVHPATWKAKLGITISTPKGLTEQEKAQLKKQRKGLAIITAKKLFPDIELIPDGKEVEQDGIAEAALLAEYGRQETINRTGTEVLQ